MTDKISIEQKRKEIENRQRQLGLLKAQLQKQKKFKKIKSESIAKQPLEEKPAAEKCPYCKQPTDKNNKFCEHCGKPLKLSFLRRILPLKMDKPISKTCKTCKTTSVTDSKYCEECGNELVPALLEKKEKITPKTEIPKPEIIQKQTYLDMTLRATDPSLKIVLIHLGIRAEVILLKDKTAKEKILLLLPEKIPIKKTMINREKATVPILEQAIKSEAEKAIPKIDIDNVKRIMISYELLKLITYGQHSKILKGLELLQEKRPAEHEKEEIMPAEQEGIGTIILNAKENGKISGEEYAYLLCLLHYADLYESKRTEEELINDFEQAIPINKPITSFFAPDKTPEPPVKQHEKIINKLEALNDAEKQTLLEQFKEEYVIAYKRKFMLENIIKYIDKLNSDEINLLKIASEIVLNYSDKNITKEVKDTFKKLRETAIKTNIFPEPIKDNVQQLIITADMIISQNIN